MGEWADLLLDLEEHVPLKEDDFTYLVRKVLEDDWEDVEKEIKQLENSFYMEELQQIHLTEERLQELDKESNLSDEFMEIFAEIEEFFFALNRKRQEIIN